LTFACLAVAGILGTWTIVEKLQAVDWQAPRAPAADKVAALKKSLAAEQDLPVPAPPALALPRVFQCCSLFVTHGASLWCLSCSWRLTSALVSQMWAADPYFGSSQAAAIGQQALIADMLHEPAIATKVPPSCATSSDHFAAHAMTSSDACIPGHVWHSAHLWTWHCHPERILLRLQHLRSIRHYAAPLYVSPPPLHAPQLRKQLKGVLDLWLAPGATRLLYDTTWGGIVSAAGMKDGMADFGSGIYNDHHFHYGYLMYAAAALGAKDRGWLKARTPALLDLIRDFANPGLGDPYFPFARQMDFYAGARVGGSKGSLAHDVQRTLFSCSMPYIL
jgi:hypothetical protein